ncbi:MAG: galactose mutarotase [Ruminococcaceae bacterium]|nr:galactose mutarotase [Oscillospiraceae bacterium]
MKTIPFGKLPDGRSVNAYIMTAGRYSATVSEYGCTVTAYSIDGTDVVLGFDDVEGYVNHGEYMGAFIGRTANRIAKGKFTLDGATYQLYINNGPNCNHGGKEGFDKKLWKAEVLAENKVRMEYVSPDMEEGYPGTLKVAAEYELCDDGTLRLDIYAETDKTTIVNFTSHMYFNLDGHDCGHDTLDQRVKMYSARVAAVDGDCLATGELLDTEGTVFDLNGERRLKEMYPYVDEQIILANGYDHSFEVSGEGMRTMMEAVSDESGIKLTCTSDQECIHIYSGNYIPDDRIGKGGAKYGKHYGFAIEAQNWANAINNPNVPSSVLNPGEKYHKVICFKLSK